MLVVKNKKGFKSMIQAFEKLEGRKKQTKPDVSQRKEIIKSKNCWATELKS
jgi:hypothetical protein